MIDKPSFFEGIRQRSADRWDQLEGDPELAGPWHQLFKQVQSPRHVLSELLQNADDAGATEATAKIDEGVFVFEHNGEDFTEEHFASLCRFGYSNKRTLHTIGFRGVGFKSTFSLGDSVELHTPTLSVAFRRQRFTEPKWIGSAGPPGRLTRIRVAITDEHRRQELEGNLNDWVTSPVSLLFFRHLRQIRIGEREVGWSSRGPGPVPGSEWMSLNGDDEAAYLVVQSDPEPFPDEALEEIRQERMLGEGEEGDFPPSQIEIVLGPPGRLYVVLPTGVETQLPFACNGPFIQDPARIKIKDPETSPTNRWLLTRAGRLAATAMLQWLHTSGRPVADRARAYGLFPDVDRADNSIEGVCGSLAEKAFEEEIEGQDLLLTDAGNVVAPKGAISIAAPILTVWSPEQAAALLDPAGRPPLSSAITSADRHKLVRWGFVEEFDRQRLIAVLLEQHLPRPEGWHHLLNLWAYLAPDFANYSYYRRESQFKIVPVQGQDVLHSARDVVRLGDKRLLQNEDDWSFLADHLHVLNPNWPRFLAEERRAHSERGDRLTSGRIDSAFTVLERVGLANASSADVVITKVAADFFQRPDMTVGDCVRFAQISAKLDVAAGSDFRFMTGDGRLRSTDEPILFDADGRLEELIPPGRRDQWLLHAEYDRSVSCSPVEWQAWIRSVRAGILTVPPTAPRQGEYQSRDQFVRALHKVGYRGDTYFPYSTGRVYPYQRYYLSDYDFASELLDYWNSEQEVVNVWATVTELLAEAEPTMWEDAAYLEARQTSTNGQSERTVRLDKTASAWARRLAELPCLPDTHGTLRKPVELLRRTRETESLLDVEPFLAGHLDTANALPLLDLLGVRNEPTGPDALLDRIRALAAAADPPAHEVERWYRRLDQLVSTCSTADMDRTQTAFQKEKLILTESDSWATTAAVYLSPDDEVVPEADVIRRSVRHLTLWTRLGVPERPTAELAIEWLKTLPSGAALSTDDSRRVRALLARHPGRIWEGCRHWLSLAGEWAPVDSLSFGVTMQSLTAWSHLHPWVRQQTAYLQHLPVDVTAHPPFSSLPPLSSRIDERISDDLSSTGPPAEKEWLRTFGTELRRIELIDEAETRRVRSLSERLAATRWTEVLEIQVIPYIDGKPAGTPRTTDVAWMGTSLYVGPLTTARLARRVPEEVARAFDRSDIKAALDYSFERSGDEVRAYLEENFGLADATEEQDDALLAERHRDQESAVGDEAGADNDKTVEAEALPSAGDEADSESPPLPNQEAAAEQVGNPPETAEPPDRQRPAPKHPKPDLIERFAHALGFQKDGVDRFFHSNGDWIARARGNVFPWERRTRDGNLVRCYWSREHCLDHEPLQLDAEIWHLLENQPDLHTLLLVDTRGVPLEITGSRLRAMRDGGEVTLYPASYRLVSRTEFT
jgi:hypothetical protein